MPAPDHRPLPSTAPPPAASPLPPAASLPAASPPVLREGTAADAAAVARLHAASRRAAYAHLVPERVLDAEDAQQEMLWTLRLEADYGTPADTPVLLLAEEPGRDPGAGRALVGFAHLVPDGGEVRLEQLHVRPDRTGGGIGTRLLRAALDRFPDVPVRLDVLAANRRAVAFYERHGARRLGRGTAHFADGTRLPEYVYGWR
ncbi:GNAT family N-acetyltransferase [Kitasatospora sp. NA04385]|uniref:GNAT family N-acetyltransferase n=1 Tax=Kitasatospora sp. NA04385 TaxID=2742135 RepID=UPI00159037C4|nr:GNAT family N-acetyltransferase [Kitasatospora sp. NA04385]QKW20206.1 GNAT family N-acetyltransferase [Kitasatospora sp. NA04385]